ncbi:MAG: hypothetical protein RM022_012040 [Nostoc sp. EfeVER01]|jgi:hypothetical protein|uniref:hypothetical protein n=1 Tax=Nostoc sp. EfeVER01 TaxID=3075406 RepID=UPI002AD39109|nr:hypothetical protein [Nostoc sp. EfeVER01]MDZ7943737.1 hypothetical protein [Nostoc sp. EfeVER01]
MSRKHFWHIIRLTYPWLPLLITLWRIIRLTGIDRCRAQVRLWILLSRIDFASLIALASDLIQPEFWA